MASKSPIEQVRQEQALFTPVAPAGARVARQARSQDTAVAEAVQTIHEEHPAVSPWYPLPEGEKEARTMLRKVRAAARDLERKVITGLLDQGDGPKKVWALGGPAKPRKPRSAA